MKPVLKSLPCDHVEKASDDFATAPDHVEMATLHVNGIVATAGLRGV
jgi:hypothetical protein